LTDTAGFAITIEASGGRSTLNPGKDEMPTFSEQLHEAAKEEGFGASKYVFQVVLNPNDDDDADPMEECIDIIDVKEAAKIASDGDVVDVYVYDATDYRKYGWDLNLVDNFEFTFRAEN
jgi:hypothetical protein